MKNIIFILAVLLTLGSCKKDVAESGPFTFNKVGGSPSLPTIPTGMSLVSPVSSPAFIAAPTLLITGAVAGEMVRVYRNSTCSTLVATAIATSSSMALTTATLPIGVHNFYLKSTNNYATSSCSGALMSYQYLGVAPKNATSIALQSPASSPSDIATPTFLLSGLVSGETSKLYIDSNCTLSYGSGVASGTSALITLSPLAPAVHQIYTNSTNAAGTGSCSIAMTSYQYIGVMPLTASSLVLSSPAVSPNYDSTPTFLASGIMNGDTVKIYTDSGCSTLVGSALSSTISVMVTTSALSVGSYTFYTNTSNTIGTSACSSAMASYNYAGPPPNISVSWTGNHETAVNRAGGGYRIYYRQTAGVDIYSDSYYDVPYVSGAHTPVSKTLNDLYKGTTYFKVVAYSSLNAPGTSTGSSSLPSAEFSVTIP